MQKTKLIVFILSVSFLACSVTSCDNRHSKEKEEAKLLLSTLQDVECMQSYSLWDIKTSDSSIDICLWGDCDLKDIFEITSCANEFLETHTESIICADYMELSITFFDHEPSERDYDRMRFYACVMKRPQDSLLVGVNIESSKTVYTSGFRDCQVPFEWVELPCLVEFDDPEAFDSIQSLENVCFEVPSNDTTSLREVLQDICYFDENDVNIDFRITFIFRATDREGIRVYNDFVKAHADYKVFQDENGELFLYDEN